MLTNRQCSFQNSCVIETGQSDFHKTTVAAFISYFQKAEPKIISYRDFKIFPNHIYISSLYTHSGHKDKSNVTSVNLILGEL